MRFLIALAIATALVIGVPLAVLYVWPALVVAVGLWALVIWQMGVRHG